MPPEQIPSLGKYMREHSTQQILARFSEGASTLLQRASHSYGYFKYVVIYATASLLVILFQPIATWRAIRARPYLVLFMAAFLTSYFFLYAWYTRIAPGNRFMLGQFLPCLFVFSLILTRLAPRDWKVPVEGARISVLTFFNLCLLGFVSLDSYHVLTQRILSIYGGD